MSGAINGDSTLAIRVGKLAADSRYTLKILECPGLAMSGGRIVVNKFQYQYIREKDFVGSSAGYREFERLVLMIPAGVMTFDMRPLTITLIGLKANPLKAVLKRMKLLQIP